MGSVFAYIICHSKVMGGSNCKEKIVRRKFYACERMFYERKLCLWGSTWLKWACVTSVFIGSNRMEFFENDVPPSSV